MEGFNLYRPSSSQDTVQHRRKYHVFLSFRGPNTRKSLVDHLFQSLSAAGFDVFLDTEKLEKGENIGISLEEAIRDSTVHIPIFSSDYASSAWCLQELWLIWTCKSTCPETKTIPLFYDVEPSVVRHQTGIYAESLEALRAKGRHTTAEMDKWKEALHEVSLLSGWSLSLTAEGYEGKLVKRVVTDLIRTLKIHEMHVANHPVGLSGPIKELTKLLEMENDIDQLTVGIWGMGGLGKTTLSRAVYNKIHDQFEASCFVSDIRATAKESVKGLVNLQRQILRELVERNTKFYSVAAGKEQMKKCLASKKVVVILDDVDDENQLDALAGNCYGLGSRIIITSRDRKVLQGGKIDKIHPMKGLSKHAAVRLFSWHAFLRAYPESEYEDMTKEIVNACQDVPLALEILGAYLYGERRMGIWREALIKIQENVYPSLKISYDALTYEAQQMFLDIACFFVNMSSKYVGETCTFYHNFWEALGCKTVHTSLASLEDKSLIRIEDSGSRCSFWMHDHLRDLGRQIVEDESPHDPSKRSRLWCKEDIISVLQHTGEMREVRGLMLTKLELHGMHNLASMHNLKFLFCLDLNLEEEEEEEEDLSQEEEEEDLSQEEVEIGGSSGKYFSFPPFPGSLIHFVLQDCRELQNLSCMAQMMKLKTLRLSHCASLAQLPELNLMQSLRALTLRYCKNLKELPPLPENLVHIEVERCFKLQKLSRVSPMTKLETLHVSYCKSLAQLPELNWMKSLRELKLSWCDNLKELPPLPESLIHIKVESCCKLQKLPSMSHKIKLETLHVSYCESLAQLPELDSMKSLRELELSWCMNLKELPPLPESLIHIKVKSCFKPQQLSSVSHIIKLETLHVYYCGSLAQLPELNWMKSLKELELSCCKNLKELPPLPKSLIRIKVESCFKLQKLSSMSQMIKLEILHLSSCTSLAQLPELNWMKSLRELELSWCTNLKELSPLPESLIHIKVGRCFELQKLSSMSHMIKLETLHVSYCESLLQLPELKWMKSLRELKLSCCKNLKELPPLPEGLHILTLDGCENLKELPSLQEGFIIRSTQGYFQGRRNASQPSTRDDGKRVTSEPNNETDPSAMWYFPKRCRTMKPSPCFSVQNSIMEQGESYVPRPADQDYEIPHNLDTAYP